MNMMCVIGWVPPHEWSHPASLNPAIEPQTHYVFERFLQLAFDFLLTLVDKIESSARQRHSTLHLAHEDSTSVRSRTQPTRNYVMLSTIWVKGFAFERSK